MAIVDGIKVKTGDYISFKADYEEVGKITKIQGSTLTILVDEDRVFVESASRCWIEE